MAFSIEGVVYDMEVDFYTAHWSLANKMYMPQFPGGEFYAQHLIPEWVLRRVANGARSSWIRRTWLFSTSSLPRWTWGTPSTSSTCCQMSLLGRARRSVYSTSLQRVGAGCAVVSSPAPLLAARVEEEYIVFVLK